MLHATKTMRRIYAHMQHNQKIIETSADNLARHPLPGSKAKEVAPYNFKDYVGKHPSSSTTHPRHIPLSNSSAGAKVSISKDSPEISANGNNIVPERELQRTNEAALDMNSDMKSYTMMFNNVSLFTTLGK